MTERLFSAMVRACRVKRKLSQVELAMKMCRTQARVAQIESGREALSESTLEEVADALGLTMLQFLREGLRLVEKEDA
jgi:transcriptional regulator with XRE-family HTH domain